MLTFVENVSLVKEDSNIHRAVTACHKYHSHREPYKEIFCFFPWIRGIAHTPQEYSYAYGGTEVMRQQLLGKRSLSYECVIMNGKYEDSLSYLPEGVEVFPYKEALESFATFMQRLRVEEHPLAFVNAESSQDGVVIYIPDGKVIDEQIFVHHIIYPVARGNLLFSPKVIVVFGREACAAVHVFHHIEVDCRTVVREMMVNGVTEVFVSEKAEAIISIDPRYAHESQFSWSHIATIQAGGAGAVVHHLLEDARSYGLFENTFYLMGDYAHAESVVAARSPRKTWVRNLMHHDAKHTTSQQKIRSVLDSGEFLFEGGIKITPQGEYANAYQRHDTLLLDDQARVSTYPRLEILTDEVKASHGATVGSMDEKLLFYMRSRGLPLKLARERLVQGFLKSLTPTPETFPRLSKVFKGLYF